MHACFSARQTNGIGLIVLPLYIMTKNELDLSLTRYTKRTEHSLSVKAVLFDMDGVLYDSMKHHERSWLETAQAHGLSMSQHDVYMFEGQTGPQTINILMERTHQRKASQEEIKSIYAMKTRLSLATIQANLFLMLAKS